MKSEAWRKIKNGSWWPYTRKVETRTGGTLRRIWIALKWLFTYRSTPPERVSFIEDQWVHELRTRINELESGMHEMKLLHNANTATRQAEYAELMQQINFIGDQLTEVWKGVNLTREQAAAVIKELIEKDS